jgi:Ca2+-binding RTX toxin-like protein
LGKGDFGTGGTGADLFWLDGSSNADATTFATLGDYQRGTDRIEIRYTPVFGTNDVEVPPTLSVTMGPNNAYAIIQFNGDILAHVTGATTLTTADIRLVRES